MYVKISHEEFLKRAKEKNNKVTVIGGEYKNAKSRIDVRCNTCGYEWNVVAHSIIQGYGCKKCANRNTGISNSKSNEKFIKQLEECGSNIQLLEEYKRSNIKIKCKCKACNNIWYALPSNLYKGEGCPECRRINNLINQTKTNEKFLKELNEKGSCMKPMEEYKQSHTKMKFMCTKCGAIVYSTPTNVLTRVNSCRNCSNIRARERLIMSQEEFIKKVKENNEHIDIISNYEGIKKKITAHCRNHDVTWTVMAESLINGSGCKLCGNNKQRNIKAFSMEEFKERISDTLSHITIIGEYVNARTKITCKCNIHDYEFDASPDRLMTGETNCPLCTSSTGERFTATALEKMGIEYRTQYTFKDTKEIRNKRFDFYIPSKNIAIEYDGAQHYIPVALFGGEAALEKNKINDKIKDDYCKEKGIRLIRIPYTVTDIEQYLRNELEKVV